MIICLAPPLADAWIRNRCRATTAAIADAAAFPNDDGKST
jgi:hypothetical protein